jgi:hypothetical protein
MESWFLLADDRAANALTSGLFVVGVLPPDPDHVSTTNIMQ